MPVCNAEYDKEVAKLGLTRHFTLLGGAGGTSRCRLYTKRDKILYASGDGATNDISIQAAIAEARARGPAKSNADIKVELDKTANENADLRRKIAEMESQLAENKPLDSNELIGEDTPDEKPPEYPPKRKRGRPRKIEAGFQGGSED